MPGSWYQWYHVFIKGPTGSACRQTPSCCAYRPAACQARLRQCAFRHDIPPPGRWSGCSRPERADSCGRSALAKRLHVCLSAGPAGCCRGSSRMLMCGPMRGPMCERGRWRRCRCEPAGRKAHVWAHVWARAMAQIQCVSRLGVRPGRGPMCGCGRRRRFRCGQAGRVA